jgi:SAM-dependent methyltransferase
VLETARARPEALVVGVDANATALAEASRRAARPARKGGLDNALFVLAAAEAPPAELAHRADLVTVHFPWGSLLDGVLGRNARAADGLATLLRPGGELVAVLALTPRDHAGSIADLAPLDGMALTELRPATVAEVAATHSTWARRLRRGDVWRLVMRSYSRP